MSVTEDTDVLTRVEQAGARRKNALEPCVISFFDGKDAEGKLVDFLPEQKTIVLRADGFAADRVLGYESVRALHLTRPVNLKRSIEHFRKHGVNVRSLGQEMPFTVTFRDGQIFAGDLLGYGAAAHVLGLFIGAAGDEAVRWYFPTHGIESFAVDEVLGKLIIGHHKLNGPGLEGALHEQRRLRSEKLAEMLAEKRIVDPVALSRAIRPQYSSPIRRIGEILVELSILTRCQLTMALRQHEQSGRPLGEVLIDMGLIDRATFGEVLARQLGIPHVDVAHFKIEDATFVSISPSLLYKFRAIPLYRIDGALVIAMENPLDPNAVDALQFAAQQTLIPVLASHDEIETVLRREHPDGMAYGAPGWHAEGCKAPPASPEKAPRPEPDRTLAADLASQLVQESELKDTSPDDLEDQVRETDSTLVRLVNKIIMDAHEQRASDIHIESRPGNENTRVRFRRDGALYDYLEVPARFRYAMVSRIKIMANLDISERRKPQDGKIDFKRYGPAPIELRVATLPTNNNLEVVVLRILGGVKPIPLDRLHLAPPALDSLRKLVEKPYGLILVCGPTGSGKTTMLHSLIAHVNTPDLKIWTAEDPVEITQPGLNQVQVNPRIGWDFATALRAFLRADPDIIMVGEMRDRETAHIAVEASLTGHLVLSTLHTNSAPESVTRLLDLGIDAFSLSDSLLGVLAQRLARQICPHCHTRRAASVEDLDSLAEEYCHGTPLEPSKVIQTWMQCFGGDGAIQLPVPHGCAECGKTGYRGRIALHELLVATPAIRNLIRKRTPASEVAVAASGEGMLSLKQDGFEKMLQGFTTAEQVRAVCV